jgi:hypothetical protein
MSIDKQGKNSIHKPTLRPNENKAKDVTTLINQTKDRVERTIKK